MINPIYKNLSILIIEDHPVVADAYINLIKSASDEFDFIFTHVNNCLTAFKQIELYLKTNTTLDIALIDINVPSYPEEMISSGTDIAKLIRDKFPLCKIIVVTMHSEHLILNNVFKIVNPEGFISKSDINFSSFADIFIKILEGQSFYSPTINKSLQTLLRNAIKWDEFDTQIVLLTAKNIKNKYIADHLNISLSTVEKRKANIKRQIADKKVSDDELIKLCKMLKLL